MVIAGLVFVCIILILRFQTESGFSRDFDLENYHFYNPYALLTNRYDVDVDIAPAQLQTYLNPIADIPFYLSVVLFNDHPHLVSLLLNISIIINVVLVYLICRVLTTDIQHPLIRGGIIGVALLLVLAAPTIQLELGTTSGDFRGSWAILLNLYIFLRIIQGTAKLRWLYVAGFILGMMAGLKLTVAFVGAIPLFLTAVYITWRYSILTWRNLVFWCVTIGVGFLLAGGFWMLLLMSEYGGNPLLPFYNGIFKSPYFLERNWTPNQDLPKSLGEALLFPILVFASDDVSFGAIFSDPTLFVGLVMVMVLGAWLGFRRIQRRGEAAESHVLPNGIGALILFYGCAYVIWLFTSGIVRYVAHLSMLTAILAPVGLYYVFTNFRRYRLIIWLLASVLIVFFVAVESDPRFLRRNVRDAFFEVIPPSVEDGSHVFLLFERPMSYVVPFMNPNAHYIGFENNIYR